MYTAIKSLSANHAYLQTLYTGKAYLTMPLTPVCHPFFALLYLFVCLCFVCFCSSFSYSAYW